MSETRKKFASGIYAFADQIVVSGASFLTVLLVTRNCSDEDVGTFALAWTVIAFIRTIQERTIAAPFLAFSYNQGFERSSFRGSSIFHQAVFALASTVLTLMVTSFIGVWQGDSSQIWFGVSIGFALAINLVRDQMRAISYTEFAFLRLFLLDVAVVACQLLGFAVLSQFDSFTITNANYVIGTACIAPVAFWLFVTRRTFVIERSWIWADWKNNWIYARWLVGSRALGIAPVVVIPFLIAFFEGKAATGTFSVCSSLVGVSLMFVSGANNMFLPRTIQEMQKNGTSAMLASVGEALVVIISILVGISVAFWFFGGPLLYIYKPKYSEFGLVAFLLSISTLVVSISIILGNGLAALKYSKEFFLGEVSCCVVSIMAALILIPLMEIYGACIASILGGLAATIVTGMSLFRGVQAFDRQNEDVSFQSVSSNCELRRA